MFDFLVMSYAIIFVNDITVFGNVFKVFDLCR